MTETVFEPHAAALRDHVERGERATFELVCEDGAITSIAARDYISFDAQECPLHALALARAHGRIWDLGAGAGRHALVLQHLNNDVLALDNSPACVALMRDRGVTQTACKDVRTLSEGSADTMLLLNHGIGIAGKLDAVEPMLQQLRARLTVGGSLWVDGRDGAGRAFERRHHREIRGFLRYKGERGPSFDWVYLNRHALVGAAERAGLSCAFVAGVRNGLYVAELQRTE